MERWTRCIPLFGLKTTGNALILTFLSIGSFSGVKTWYDVIGSQRAKNTPVSLTHPNPPHAIPTQSPRNELCGNCLGMPPRSPHLKYRFFSFPRKKTPWPVFPMQSSRNPNSFRSQNFGLGTRPYGKFRHDYLSPRKIRPLYPSPLKTLTLVPIPTQSYDLAWVSETGVFLKYTLRCVRAGTYTHTQTLTHTQKYTHTHIYTHKHTYRRHSEHIFVLYGWTRFFSTRLMLSGKTLKCMKIVRITKATVFDNDH